jgi:hypothetical protein
MTTQGAEITFEVAGWPPTKGEAKSMLAADNSRAERVRLLLQAARHAAENHSWVTTAAEIGLELIVRRPTRPMSDATNYLGGVGDVLQDKVLGRNVDISHLGDLALVALYADDRQIRDIRYAEEVAGQPSYTVRIYHVGAPVAAPPVATTPTYPTADEAATERGRRVIDALYAKGTELGFVAQREYPVPGGRLDVVWLLPVLDALPGLSSRPPVVGFEIESSWRTRKHLKGDYLNLHDLAAAVGVLVLLGDGDDVDSTRRFAQTLVDRPGPRVLVWSEREVQQLLTGTYMVPGVGSIASAEPARSPVEPDPGHHVGKFRVLWAWLRDQPGDQLPMMFSDIEEIIGMPLPSSCRKHPAHRSSYESSAVARAIQDAGWAASQVDVRTERLVFVQRRGPGS